jgi:CRP/FNR family transcriptional regulator, cyclic AMP receptor protein
MSLRAPIRSVDHRFVHLLDHDAGLRRALPESERMRARQHAVAAVADLPPGPWDAHASPFARAELGLLVLDGLIIRDVSVSGATCGELIGPCTLLRPCDDRGAEAPMRHDVSWQVLAPARVAVLDAHFLQVAAHWPPLITALLSRAIERVHDLAVLVSIHNLKRVDDRLLAYFWQLADRYGRVTADGVIVPLPLTHRQLALLVGAQRPSVTSALGALAERGELHRDEHGQWLLAGEQPGTSLDDEGAVATRS